MLNPIETGTYEVGPRDYLTTFWHYVSTLRNGETKFVGLLQAKIREVHPTLAVSLGFPPPTPSSTHSRSSSNNPRPALIQPLSQMDSIQSHPSSPFGSPPSLAGAPQLTSTPLSFPLPGHMSASTSEAGEAAASIGMTPKHDVASPSGSASDGGLPDNRAGGTSHPYSMPFGSSSTY